MQATPTRDGRAGACEVTRSDLLRDQFGGQRVGDDDGVQRVGDELEDGEVLERVGARLQRVHSKRRGGAVRRAEAGSRQIHAGGLVERPAGSGGGQALSIH